MSPRPELEQVRVTVDERQFIVGYDGHKAGIPRVIYERVVYCEGAPWQSLYNTARWHRNSHGVPTRKSSLYFKVMEAAKAKRAKS